MSQEIQLPPDDLIRRTRGDVAFVVNFSGGKDSMRMLGRVRELYPNNPIFVVMADTGFEHVRPISAKDWSGNRSPVTTFPSPLCATQTRRIWKWLSAAGCFQAPQLGSVLRTSRGAP